MKKILSIENDGYLYQIELCYPTGESEWVSLIANHDFTAGQVAKGWLKAAPLADSVMVMNESNKILYTFTQSPSKPIMS